MDENRFSFEDVIRMARTIADRPGFLELRGDYALRHKLDKDSEDLLLRLRYMMRNEPMRVVSVRSVYDAVVEKIGRTIRLIGVQTDSESRCVYGYVEDDGDSPVIVYNRSLNLCWRRFTIVKELMHLYAGILPYSRSVPGVDGRSVSETIIDSAVESRRVLPQKVEKLDEETAALYATLEVLLPWKLRNQLVSLASYHATIYQIAKAFLIPFNFVQFALIAHPSCGESYFSYSMRKNNEFRF